jgi:hypothetical protein
LRTTSGFYTHEQEAICKRCLSPNTLKLAIDVELEAFAEPTQHNGDSAIFESRGNEFMLIEVNSILFDWDYRYLLLLCAHGIPLFQGILYYAGSFV